MKMSRKQLNAISYAYYEKQYKGQVEVLMKYDLFEDWRDSKYRTMTGYLKNAYKKGIIKNWLEVYGK